MEEPFIKYREFVPPRNWPYVVGLIIATVVSLIVAVIVG